MSQCHDSYELTEYELTEAQSGGNCERVALPLGSAQCHDSYGSEEPDAAPSGARNDCRIVDTYRDRVHVLRVLGKVDWATAGQFRDAMNHATEAEVVIALAGPTTDSAGTGALVGIALRAHQLGQHLVIVAPEPLQYEVLVAVGLDGEVPVTRSEAEAFQWLAEHRVAASPPS